MNNTKITSRTEANKAARLERKIWASPFTYSSIEEGVLLLQLAAEYWQKASELVPGRSPDRDYFQSRKEYCLHDGTEKILRRRCEHAGLNVSAAAGAVLPGHMG